MLSWTKYSTGISFAAGLLAAVTSGHLGGCTRQSTPQTATLTVHVSSEPVSLDPALAEDGISLRILANTSEGLYGYDSAGNLIQRLADSHDRSTDGKRHSFRIRKDARWSDGVPVTAGQFVLGLKRSLGPGSVSKLAPSLSMIRNAYEAEGALVLELEKPVPHFLHALTLPIAFPVRQDVLDSNQGRWPVTAPVTGPYKVESHLPDRKILLAKNPHYYDKHGGPSRAELVIVADESTAGNLFEQGKLDILTRIAPSDFDRLKKSGQVRTDPFFATYFLSFNTRIPPFDRPELRRAISNAIDRKQIVAVLDSGETPALSWIPPGIEGGIPHTPHSEKTAERHARLEKLPPVTAGFDGNTRNFLIMQKVQQDLLQKLGLKIELRNTDWKSHVRSLQSDPPPIFRFGWQAPFHDPISHLRAFTSSDPNNYTGWKSPLYDRLVDEIETLPPGPTRAKKILQAQELLLETEAIVVPIYHYVQNHAVSHRVHGFRANPFGMIFLRELRITEKPKQ